MADGLTVSLEIQEVEGMTAKEVVQMLVRYSLDAYYEQWLVWELSGIAVTCLLVFVLVVMRRRRAAAKVRCLPGHYSVIGIRLLERGHNRIMPRHWKMYLLITTFISLSLSALWLQLLRPSVPPKAEPARGLSAVSLGGAAVPGKMAPVLGAEAEETAGTETDLFDGNYENFYNKYRNTYALLAFSNEFVELPGFDPLDESKGYTHGYADAGSALPDWEAGRYGSIPPRRIIQILGPDEMLVAGLISEGGRLARFRGWFTAGLRSGQIWPSGPLQSDPNEQAEPLEVAVEGQYTYRTLLGKSVTVPSVVPLRLFREGITPEQFRDLLLTRTELPDDLRQLKSGLVSQQAALSEEKRPRTTQAGL